MSPCPSPSDLSSAVAALPLQAGGLASGSSSPAAGNTSAAAPFSSVLSQVDKSPAPAPKIDDEKDDTDKAADDKNGKPDNDQLAALMALMVQAPAPQNSPVTPPAADATDRSSDDSAAPAIEGRSVRQLLAQVPGTAASVAANQPAAVDANGTAAAAEAAPAAADAVPGTAASVRRVASNYQSAAAAAAAANAGATDSSKLPVPAAPAPDAASASAKAPKLNAEQLAAALKAANDGAPSSADKGPTPTPAAPPAGQANPLSAKLLPDSAAGNSELSGAGVGTAPQASENKSPVEAAVQPAVPGTATDTAAATSATTLAAAGTVIRTAVNATGRSAPAPAEKIAGAGSKQAAVGEKTPVASSKNTILEIDEQQVSEKPARVGTTAANWGKNMSNELRNFAAAPLAELSVQGSHGSAAFDTIDQAAATPAVQVSRASELVHEIHQIADGLSSVERNTVEVKFRVGEDERLSVRVEYRDGQVRATFRTDSPELRAAIATEWKGQPVASEHRSYRFADPVFTTSASSSSGFAAGEDSSRQQRSAEQPVPFARAAATAASRSAASTTKVVSTATPARTDATAGRLHAIA